MLLSVSYLKLYHVLIKKSKIILSKKFGGDFKNLKSEDLIKMTKYLKGEKYE